MQRAFGDAMNERQLIEQLLTYNSCGEMHAAIQAWLQTAKRDDAQSVYAVFGYPLTHPGSRELLGVYSTIERAERFVAAQDAVVQSNIGVVEITLDDHPSDEFWIKPGEPADSAAGIPGEAVDDRSSGRIAEHLGWRKPTTQFTGTCRCGHRLEAHHNGGWLSAAYLATMPQGTRPLFGDECEYYGFNEEGGLGPDLRVHCLRYVDRGDPDPPDPALPGSRGTFTRTARAWAWARLGWKAMQVKLLRRDPRIVWRRERW